nr:precorrin-2 C(20)-methyltransferase [Actinomadura rayongensis]
MYGVGLGPGDPELITLKAARLIEAADVVVFHAARHGRSHARAIAAAHLHDGQIEEPLIYPVTTEATTDYRTVMEAFYEDCARRLAVHLDAGRDVVVLAEGDPFFYGSYMHLHKRLAGRYPTTVVPGVTSIAGASAELGRPLVERDETLTVLPGTLGDDALADRLRAADSAVVLKLGRTFTAVRTALERAERLDDAWYVEHATTGDQRIERLADVAADTVPYFSVAVLPSRIHEETRRTLPTANSPQATTVGLTPAEAAQQPRDGGTTVNLGPAGDASGQGSEATAIGPAGAVQESRGEGTTVGLGPAGDASEPRSAGTVAGAVQPRDGGTAVGLGPAGDASQPRRAGTVAGTVQPRDRGTTVGLGSAEDASEPRSAETVAGPGGAVQPRGQGTAVGLGSAGDASQPRGEGTAVGLGSAGDASGRRAAGTVAGAVQGRGAVTVVGLGPAGREWLTPQAQEALAAADDLVGYRPYLDRVAPNARQRRHPSGNTVEADRAAFALELAREGRRVAVVSSGDPGVFAMATAVLEAAEAFPDVPVRVLPGVTAANAVAARAGAPLGHDYCVLSLSDRLKPWDVIARRLTAAAESDLVIAIYNPASKTRVHQVAEARDLLLRHRAKDTPVVIGRDVGGPAESVRIVPLADLDPADVDMRCLLIVGSSQTRRAGDTVFTPRRYP